MKQTRGTLNLKTLYIVLILLPPGETQKDTWKFAQNKEGIEIYTRQPEGTKFKEFKGITEIELSLHSAVAVLTDVESMPDWVADCESTKLIANQGKRVIYHMIISVPFPFENRDMVQELIFNYDKSSGRMEILLRQNNEAVAPIKGITRMPVSVGKWTFEPINKNTYNVIFEYLSDPGGALPAWLVNSFLIRMPYKTLSGFRERVNYPEYKLAEFDWLEAPN